MRQGEVPLHAVVAATHIHGAVHLAPVRVIQLHLLRLEANQSQLEKARVKKEKKQLRLAALRQARAEKRLTRPLP